MEDYSDGIDTNGSLKYERTLNRDINNTIERINRAESFKGTANDVIDIISPIMKKDVDKLFRDVWRSKHDSHANPNGLAIALDIVPPVLKKVHPEGDTDKYFKMHKQYPFYYLMNLKASLKFIPNENDPMKDEEAWYGKWFMENISPTFSRRVLGKVKSDLATKFNNIFSFPSLEATDRNKEKNNSDGNSVKKIETIEESVQYTLNRINIVFNSTLKFNKSEGSETGITTRYDSTEDMKNVLIFSTSMAFERLFNG